MKVQKLTALAAVLSVGALLAVGCEKAATEPDPKDATKKVDIEVIEQADQEDWGEVTGSGAYEPSKKFDITATATEEDEEFIYAFQKWVPGSGCTVVDKTAAETEASCTKAATIKAAFTKTAKEVEPPPASSSSVASSSSKTASSSSKAESSSSVVSSSVVSSSAVSSSAVSSSTVSSSTVSSSAVSSSSKPASSSSAPVVSSSSKITTGGIDLTKVTGNGMGTAKIEVFAGEIDGTIDLEVTGVGEYGAGFMLPAVAATAGSTYTITFKIGAAAATEGWMVVGTKAGEYYGKSADGWCGGDKSGCDTFKNLTIGTDAKVYSFTFGPTVSAAELLFTFTFKANGTYTLYEASVVKQ